MNKNNEVEIEINKWYEFMYDEDIYMGKCLREPFLNKIKGIYEVGFLCHKNNKEKNYYDLDFSELKIKSIKEIEEPTEYLKE